MTFLSLLPRALARAAGVTRAGLPWTLAVLVAVGVSISAPCEAAAERVAVVVSGRTDQGTLNLVQVITERTLERRGLEVIAGGTDQLEAATLEDCVVRASSDCVASLLSPLRVDNVVLVVATSERVAGGADITTLKARLLQSRDGAEVAARERRCEKCSAEQLDAAIAELTGQIVDAWRSAGKGTLRVQSTPSGAQVAVDGEARGATPTDVEVPAGPHELVLELDGYVGARRTLEVGAGQTVEATFALDPRAPRSSLRYWKWVAGGVSAVALVGGVGLMLADESAIDSDNARRPSTLNTMVPGAVLTAVGVGGGVLTWYLFHRDAQLERTVPQVSVSPDGVWLGVAGGF